MKRLLVILGILGILGVTFKLFRKEEGVIVSPITSEEDFLGNQKPLLKYSFSALSKREYPGSQIKTEKLLENKEGFKSYLFSYLSDGKKVTGLLNLPEKQGKLPVVIMLRGYVDLQIYQTGIGTKKPAEYFAQNGFITLAPDFLGYGDSESEDKDILVNRFEKPVTALNLLASVKSLPQADTNNIFLWGHSNGGQIALSVLEISGKLIPTTLWAPVTRGFPESVLNYSAQLDDNGKIVADRIEEFNKIYDPKLFSISEFFGKINSPIQIHLGTWDEYIKEVWLEEFVEELKSLKKEVVYFTYPKDNHQLKKYWDTVVKRDLEFFRKNLKV